MIREIDSLTIRHLDRVLPDVSGKPYTVVICFTIEGVEYILDYAWTMDSYPRIDSVDWVDFDNYKIGKADYLRVKTIGQHGHRATHSAMDMTHFLAINGVLV